MGCKCTRSLDNENSSQWQQNLRGYQELEGQEVGEGIKRTKAWTASVSLLELLKLREQFWSSRSTGTQQSWMHLKQASETDAGSAALILELAGILVENGCMTVCYDNVGHRYDIPLFLLNEPSIQKSPLSEHAVQGIALSIKVRQAEKDIELEINSALTVADLKMSYASTPVRMFFGGKEMLDKRPLWSYGLENGMVVLVFQSIRK